VSATERIGLLLPGEPDIRRMIALAQRAEALGYESIWFAETRFTRDAIVAAAAVATATTSVKIGTAVVNPYTRGAVLTAVTFASLDELSGGRMIIGLGPGSPNVLAKQGIDWTDPLARVRSTVATIRSLLAGETVAPDGSSSSLTGAKLDFTPIRSRLPIYLGVTGPRALELAGEIADGVILNGLLPTAYLERARGQIGIGANRAGRDIKTIETVGILTTAVHNDGAAARDTLRPLIVEYLTGFPQLARETGVSPDQIVAIAQARDRSHAEAESLVTDEIIASLACAGTPDECRAILGARRESGIDVPLISVAAGDLDLAIETFAPNQATADLASSYLDGAAA
jgi:5,10-methylenetetrahydromethanopterin reductase